jgi:DNA-binding transcriptional ArsR family regulator
MRAPSSEPGTAPEPTTTAESIATVAAAAAADVPERERIVSDVETLKALSDPLRLKILETMVGRSGEPWSAKDLAAALGVPQTRLYHHIELLLERDLIRVAGQRVVSGIIETRYRVAALSLRLDRRLLAGDADTAASTRAMVATVIEGARDDLEVALRNFAALPEGSDQAFKPIVTRGRANLVPARAAELRERLVALLDEYEADPDAPEARPYSLLLALYAAPESRVEVQE